jgi:HTH-type transcriptional regulator, glycine betaine synthesis regulator
MRWKLVREAGRPADVVAFDEAVVTFFIGVADMLGVPRSMAAIYGVCFASPDPLHASDITDRLGISVGSAGMGLRCLCKIGALKIAPAPAPSVLALYRRRQRWGDHYTPDKDLKKVALYFLKHRLEEQLESGEARLKTIHDSIPVSGDVCGVEELRGRLRQLQTWHEQVQALVPKANDLLGLSDSAP